MWDRKQVKRARMENKDSSQNQAPQFAQLQGNTPQLLPYRQSTPKVHKKIAQASARTLKHTPRWQHSNRMIGSLHVKREKRPSKPLPETPVVTSRTHSQGTPATRFVQVRESVYTHRLQPTVDCYLPADPHLAQICSVEGYSGDVEAAGWTSERYAQLVSACRAFVAADATKAMVPFVLRSLTRAWTKLDPSAYDAAQEALFSPASGVKDTILAAFSGPDPTTHSLATVLVQMVRGCGAGVNEHRAECEGAMRAARPRAEGGVGML
ncbi:hsp71-like protein [Carpediemonas membranifera]|uniref:Hsp71-like protein n=1 Tax=Carpediemonas membranifera TaxID=201153 RepID=A0A8J6EB24_9EUKA|nr:hsp71-like protein [Carpediemonas membranifera]|eukprot:KAG9396040.1 hsp71-like protein [Carpediemonas membranifera]